MQLRPVVRKCKYLQNTWCCQETGATHLLGVFKHQEEIEVANHDPNKLHQTSAINTQWQLM
jgi:hypothetical protein